MSANLRHIVVAGPSGSGKSSVGRALADHFGLPFIDGDDLHPAANIAKMSAGTALDDADRMPWLDIVASTLAAASEGLVVACSALARRYRDQILRGCPDAMFIELRVPAAELERRMLARSHFMPPALLRSQLEAWEPLGEDEPGASVAADQPIADVVAEAVAALED
ncbi:gluconate kinase [Microbacterium mangrovi]|uniref:Gluconokinase n=1 Tax=Microbacterium mangrovi TaxID=1348253 RepID=A0A0B2A5Y6_9MICO|nr:gluconokinase, GntK/IdnK-type [Microbacterium mangrovi]KHK98495.1 gluconate kinase [Microbacterium mangrovi]